MLLIHARVIPMDGPEIACGYVQIKNGKITAVGKMEDCDKQAEQIIDLHGKQLLPGLIDAHSHLGLMGDSLGIEGDDINEESEPVTPHLRSIDAINPFDRAFADARQAGVTCIVVSPGSANPIAGEICALKTVGRCVDTMTVAQPLGIKFALGENPKMTYGAKTQTPMTRMATAALIREQLHKAKRYWQDKETAQEDVDLDEPEYDAKCEALIPLFKGEIRAHFHAHKAYDILTAVRIAQEFDLDLTLVHCTEGYLIADLLAETGAPVVCGPLICARTKPELAGISPDNCSSLVAAGVTVGISTDHPEVPVGLLATSAALAVTQGMSRQQALACMTIDAAKAVGLGHRIGSITPGKDADLIAYSGDPLALGSQPDMVWIAGERVI